MSYNDMLIAISGSRTQTLHLEYVIKDRPVHYLIYPAAESFLRS